MAIGLSLNPADIWKIFSDRKGRTKTEIADWLDDVAAEARGLADLWVDSSVELFAAEDGGPNERERVISELRRKYGRFACNGVPYTRLKIFYKSASSVLGKKTDEVLMTTIVDKTGDILYQRGKAKEVYDAYIRSGREKIHPTDLSSLSEETSAVNLEELTGFVEAMQNEAAALEVLAKNFRASG
jgi:hypothetical protein